MGSHATAIWTKSCRKKASLKTFDQSARLPLPNPVFTRHALNTGAAAEHYELAPRTQYKRACRGRFKAVGRSLLSGRDVPYPHRITIAEGFKLMSGLIGYLAVLTCSGNQSSVTIDECKVRYDIGVGSFYDPNALARTDVVNPNDSLRLPMVVAG